MKTQTTKEIRKKDEALFEEVRKLQQNRASDYNALYELSQKYIYKIIHDIVKDPYTTEDMMQETYLQIYNKIGTLEAPEAFYVWAGRIATNLTLRYIQKNRHEVLAGADENGDTDFVFDRVTEDTEQFIPETVLMNREKQRLIGEILDSLSPEQKICVQFFYFEEMSVREIAAAMHCSEGTVKSRLSYARKALKEAVLDMEVRKGTRLYSLAALPLFWIVFRRAVEGVVTGAVTGAAAASAAGGAARAATAGGGATGAQAAGGAAMAGAETAAAAGGMAVPSGSMAAAGGMAVPAGGMAAGSGGVTASAGGMAAPAGGMAAGTGGVAAGAAGASVAGTAATATGAAMSVKVAIVTMVSVVVVGGGGYGIYRATRPAPEPAPREETAIVAEAESPQAAAETVTYEVRPPEQTERISVEEVRREYGSVIETYEELGLDETAIEEVTEHIATAPADVRAYYAKMNQYTDVVARVRQAYRNCLSADQYAQAEATILRDMEAQTANYLVLGEQVMDFFENYGGYPVVQRGMQADIRHMDALIALSNTSYQFLSHPLAKEAASRISAAEISTSLSAGLSLPDIIILYVNAHNEEENGKFNDLVPLSEALVSATSTWLSAYQETLNIGNDAELTAIMQAYVENMSAEKKAYLEKLGEALAKYQ